MYKIVPLSLVQFIVISYDVLFYKVIMPGYNNNGMISVQPSDNEEIQAIAKSEVAGTEEQ